jgi:hypothetical protein
MAKGKADFYAHGENNVICDRCGSKFKASQLRKEWDNLMVCSICWEPRHPQDFVKGKADQQVPPYSRPEQSDEFIPVTSPYNYWQEGYVTVASLPSDEYIRQEGNPFL